MTAQQLKNSILQMAVQGKLVPQDPNDEPASVLLERIKAEKEALIKSGKIKKSKKSSEIFRGASRTLPYAFCEQIGKEIRDISDEIPFEIPESWEWCRWGELSQSIQYGYNAPAKKNGRIKMIRISDIQENKVLWDSVPYCDIDENCIENYTLKPNDILFARTGGTVGKSYLVKDIPEESIYAGYLIRTRYSNSLCPEYLKFFMESELYWIQIRNNTIATAQPNCNGKTLSNMLLPIPPLAEQKRIVAKIEELLPFIEKYEQAETKLTALNKSFPEMLKKSILQEAVQGKLVSQNPDDEPASILLERIRAEKQELIKQGKIKKSKHESIIVTRDKIPYESIDGKERCIADEVPFEIPESWEWCRLTELSSVITKGSSPKWQGITYVDEKNGILFITSENVGKEKLLMNKAKYVEKKFNDMHPTSILKFGDILTNIVGASIGRTAIYNLNSENSNINQAVCIIRLINLDFRMYIIKFLNSPIAFQMMTNNSVDSARANLSLSSVSNFLIPLPPLAEQKRIVEKINELMPIINSISK